MPITYIAVFKVIYGLKRKRRHQICFVDSLGRGGQGNEGPVKVFFYEFLFQ